MESNQLIIRSVLYKLTVLTEDTKQSTTPVINPAKILDSTEDAYDAVVCNFIDIISVIMATHLTSDLDELADYILVLDQGKQIAYMDREEMVDNFGEIELSKLLLELTGDTWIKE